jgi:hypothetical protein
MEYDIRCYHSAWTVVAFNIHVVRWNAREALEASSNKYRRNYTSRTCPGRIADFRPENCLSQRINDPRARILIMQLPGHLPGLSLYQTLQSQISDLENRSQTAVVLMISDKEQGCEGYAALAKHFVYSVRLCS